MSGGVARADTGVRVCTRGDIRLRPLGDTRSNCTVADSHLDEEDLDADNSLRTDERLLRYIRWTSPTRRATTAWASVAPAWTTRTALVRRRVHSAGSTSGCRSHLPADSINGGPLTRRVQALRITAISPSTASDDAFIATAIARLRFVGAPWLKRSSRPLAGIAGEREQNPAGYVIAGVIGTESRDSTQGLVYQSPPGVTDQPDNLQSQFDPTRVQINERSLRLQAGGLAKYDRAEAFFRFPEGQKSFMSYKELRVWARGRGNGWGQAGELQFFIKIGRDPNNFYLYRTPANSGVVARGVGAGGSRALREVLRVAREARGRLISTARVIRFRALALTPRSLRASGLPAGSAVNRFAACDGGYMVYTTDPAVAPPNLGSVQELAVGIVRVDSATGPMPVSPSDTLEVWVDDIRLTDVVNQTGFAGPDRPVDGVRRPGDGPDCGDASGSELSTAGRSAVLPDEQRFRARHDGAARPVPADAAGYRAAADGRVRDGRDRPDVPHAVRRRGR